MDARIIQEAMRDAVAFYETEGQGEDPPQWVATFRAALSPPFFLPLEKEKVK